MALETLDDELTAFFRQNMDTFSRSIRSKEPFVVTTETQKLGSQTIVKRPPPQQPVFSAPVALKAPGPKITKIEPSSGDPAGNQLVTVTGSGFVNGTPPIQLLFDNVPATLVSATSDGKIVYGYTPAHAAGVVDVKVINPDMQEDTLVGGYTYSAATTTFPYLNAVPNTLANGVITSMNLEARTADFGGGSVVDYNGTMVLDLLNGNTCMAVGTLPPFGSNIVFVHGIVTIQIQAANGCGIGVFFNLRVTDETLLFTVLSGAITVFT